MLLLRGIVLVMIFNHRLHTILCEVLAVSRGLSAAHDRGGAGRASTLHCVDALENVTNGRSFIDLLTVILQIQLYVMWSPVPLLVLTA